MKIQRSGQAAVVSSTAAASYARRPGPAAGGPATAAPASVTTILGIPEGEFTPKVRDAIMGLKQEVDSLRRDLEHAHSRLEVAERDADQDHLLPILNRRAFVRELTRSIGMVARYGTPSSLVYFDLDGFKQVNDSHGHAAGDAVLAHFAEMLHSQVRDSDVVGRIGGDEFGVILSHASHVLAHKKAASIAEVLAGDPPQWQNRAIALSFSFGAFELAPGDNADNAIARADAAMYAHKRNGTR